MTNIDPNAMGLDECCNWLAVKAGWTCRVVQGQDECPHDEWELYGKCSSHDHPIPSTLEEAAKLPERWCFDVEGYETGYTARAHSWDMVKVVPAIEADTELLARFRLRVACELAEASNAK